MDGSIVEVEMKGASEIICEQRMLSAFVKKKFLHNTVRLVGGRLAQLFNMKNKMVNMEV